MANDYITKALDAQFTPLASKIEYLKGVLNDNRASLSQAEQNQLQQQITQQQNAYNEGLQNKKDIYNVMLTAAQSGADNITLQKIQNASSPGEAAALAGSALGAKFKADQAQQEFDNKIKLAQLAIDQHKANSADGGGTYDAAQILAYAQQYASDGKIPTGIPKGSFGVLSQVAKELPKPNGALISNNTGVSPSALSATQTAGYQALSDIVTQTLPQLQELFPKISTGILGGIGGKIYTSQDRQDYLTARQEFLNKLLVARSGATVTPQEYDRYAKMLSGEFNQPLFLGSDGSKKLNSLAKNLNSSLQSNLATNQLSIVGYSTVKLGGQEYKVGQVITNAQGQQGRVNADGTITLIQ